MLIYLEDMAYESDRSRTIHYDRAYWQKYVDYAKTPLGRRLNEIRVDLVRRHGCRCPLDVGIGCGSFLEAMRTPYGNAVGYGYDVNPKAVAWLMERGQWIDPCERALPAWVDCFTFWDTLEHLPEPAELLRLAPGHVFIALPTFDHLGSVTFSKHHRPDEHYWYWTITGLQRYMADAGFACLEVNHAETQAGREAITSFAFRRD
jgi:hypothetical protein